ncbi:hypothetical protein [Mycobacterium phage PR]|nr:hypothetical protein [Mycobacterium phage PR]
MSEENRVSELHQVALRAGVFQVIEREAKAAKEAAKAELVAALPFGDTIAGRYGDEVLCKASWSKGSSKIVVVNEAALIAWVKEQHPTEIVESVNPAYMKTLKAVGENVIDGDGEVVPGVEVVTGSPTLSVRSEKNALELVAEMVAAGRVSLTELKELTAAAEADEGAAESMSYSLAEVRNGTGWPKDVRFIAQSGSEADVIDGEVVE